MSNFIQSSITWGDIIAAAVAVLIALAGTGWWWFRSLRDEYAKFEMRFLNPTLTVDPERERRSSTLWLSPGESIVRITLRPRIPIASINQIDFSAFDNRRYPMRLLPRAVGRNRIPASLMQATALRHQGDDYTWSNWQITNVWVAIKELC